MGFDRYHLAERNHEGGYSDAIAHFFTIAFFKTKEKEFKMIS